MRTRALALALLSALFPLGAAAQQAPIVQGTVADFSTHTPLSGVRVRAVSKSGSVQAISNSKGFYTLWNAPLGPVTISFSHEDYLPLGGKLCLHPGMKRVLDIRLSKNPGTAAYEHWLKSRSGSALLQTTNATTLANC